MVWTLIEPGVAIVASSLVTIRPLLRAWKIRGFQSTENSKRTNPLSYGAHASRSTGMPGFRSKDAAYVDVEASQSRKDPFSPTGTSHPSQISPITERVTESPEDADHGLKPPHALHRRSEAPSETYIIEGAPSPRLPGRTMYDDTWKSSHSATSSEVELATMQPVHTQSDGRI